MFEYPKWQSLLLSSTGHRVFDRTVTHKVFEQQYYSTEVTTLQFVYPTPYQDNSSN